MKKMVLASVLGFVVMFVLGVIWHVLLLGDFYAQQMAAVNREETRIPLIGIGYLVLAILMAYAYPIGYKGGSPLSEGLKFGILMGLLAHLPTALIYLGAWKLTATGMFVDVAYHVAEVGVGGIAIAYVYGTEKGG